MCICFFIFLIILKNRRFVVYTLYMRFIIFCNLHILAEISRMSPWTRIYMQNIRFSTNIRDEVFFLTLVANLGLPSCSIWLGNFEVATRNLKLFKMAIYRRWWLTCYNVLVKTQNYLSVSISGWAISPPRCSIYRTCAQINGTTNL